MNQTKRKIESTEDPKGFASLDGVDGSYPCICNPSDTWNGWKQPQFKKETILEILRDLPDPALEVSHIEVKGDVITWTENGDPCETTPLPNGRYILSGWTWDFVANKEQDWFPTERQERLMEMIRLAVYPKGSPKGEVLSVTQKPSPEVCDGCQESGVVYSLGASDQFCFRCLSDKYVIDFHTQS